MRQLFIIKVLTFLLLCISPFLPANAANFTYGYTPEGQHLAEHKGAIFFAFNKSIGATASIAKAYSQGNSTTSSIEPLAFLGMTANAVTFDGLLAAFSRTESKVSLHHPAIGQQSGLGSHASQLDPVPPTAAAWLFASALLGFVVVANRRKV